MPVSIPTKNLELNLKQIDFERVNFNGLSLPDLLFPSFANPIINPELVDTYSDLFGMDFSELQNDVKLTSTNRRRYDGGDTLARHSYYSVCMDHAGDDRGTLVNELYAYTSLDMTGVVRLFDFGIRDSKEAFCSLGIDYLAQEDGLYIVAIDHGSKISPFIQKWVDHGYQTTTSNRYPHFVRFAVVHVPYKMSKLAFEKIVDLRDLNSIDWLLSEVQHFDVDCYQFTKNRTYNWFYLLSLLMDPTHGGNTLTSRIGSVIRNAELDGLIFPSARSDCQVQYTDGTPSYFGGWNFVRFDTSTKIDVFDRSGGLHIQGFDPDTVDTSGTLEEGWYVSNVEERFYRRLFKEQNRWLSE